MGMIGRKLMMVKNGQIEVSHTGSFEIPYLEEAKYATIENIKKYEHILLVEIVKFYVQFSTFVKNTYRAIKIKLSNIHIKQHPNGEVSERAEVSKFVKFVSGYTRKIKEIKHKIKEEENL